MTRVVHVVHSLGTGGLEKGIATVVANASADLAHEVVCLTESGDAASLMPADTPVHEMHMPPGNSPRFVWRLSRTLKRLAPDVLHTRNWACMDSIVAARLAGIRGVVHGEHGWDQGDPDGTSRKRRFVRRALQRWVREYTCVSRHIERWLKEDVGLRKPVTQVYNGVDTDRFAPGDGSAARRELGVPEDAFLVGLVGRLDPIKDHPTLLEAFARIRAESPDAALWLVGEGDEEERLKARAGAGVRFLGNRLDVPELMRALDVFVLPSRNEGISNTILEAMASGLPIVATRVGGTPELVDGDATGTLFEPGDVDALTAALRAYRENREKSREHGANARQTALERYSVTAMVTAYETVWRRVAG